MNKWEYKVLTFSNAHESSNIRESTLNAWGEMGWEMVNAIYETNKVTIFLKRIKEYEDSKKQRR